MYSFFVDICILVWVFCFITLYLDYFLFKDCAQNVYSCTVCLSPIPSAFDRKTVLTFLWSLHSPFTVLESTVLKLSVSLNTRAECGAQLSLNSIKIQFLISDNEILVPSVGTSGRIFQCSWLVLLFLILFFLINLRIIMSQCDLEQDNKYFSWHIHQGSFRHPAFHF